jgi:hypothetical protein
MFAKRRTLVIVGIALILGAVVIGVLQAQFMARVDVVYLAVIFVAGIALLGKGVMHSR